MAEIRLPLSIIYEIDHAPTVSEVIDALRSADAIAADAAALLPSLIDGLTIERSSLNVHSLTESSLKEALFVALLVTYQSDLAEEVPPMLEDLFSISVSDKYDTIVTVVFLVVLVYGAGLAIDIARKAFTDSIPRAKLNELVDVLALETGKSSGDVHKMIESRFQKPAAAKRIVREAMRFFRPSQIDGAAPILFDRDKIGSEAIKQLPFPKEVDNEHDFSRYEPHSAVTLVLHAQDKDKSATGWAAIAKNIHDKRLKVRVVDPVQPSDLWGHNEILADIVVVKKLTSDGYTPTEIQVTAVWSKGESPEFQSSLGTE